MTITSAMLTTLVCGWQMAQAQPVELQLGKAEPLPSSIYGFNNDMVAATAFEGVTFGGPEIETAVRDLRPQTLRFPGGSTANNFLWQKDSFSEAVGDLTGWAGEHIRLFRKIGRPYDLAGYVRLCRQFKLVPVWVLNVYEETPESVTAMLDHLDSLGLKLSAIEFANEPYWDPRSLNDIQGYIRYCQPLAEALHKRPGVKVGACFAPLQQAPYPYIEKWNAVLARETWYDAIVFHDYYYGQGYEAEPGAAMSAAAVIHPDKFFDESIEALKKQAPGKPIWFTEWNLDQKYIQAWKNKGAELLFVGAGICRTIHHRDVIEISHFHQLYDKVFGALYLDDKTQVLETNASYELFKLVGAAFAHADQLSPVTLGSDDLIGFATRAGDGVRLFAINRGATPHEVKLPPECSGELRRVTLECPPETVLKDAAGFTKQQPIAGRVVTLPAYSISLIASPAALIPPAAAAQAANLFPARPHLTLWYEPHAVQQPRVAADGSYSLDLSTMKDKRMAVLKMDLSGLKLKAGVTCSLAFDARAEGGGSLTVNLPETGTADPSRKNRSEWMQIGETFRPVRLIFRHEATVNGGEVSFFFDKEQLAKGGKYVFRNFRLVTLE